MIFYNLTHGYRSKIDPSRMFTEEAEARKFDDETAAVILSGMSGISGRGFIELMQGYRSGDDRDRAQRACAHVAAVLSEIADEEERKARVAARAAEPTPPDEPEFAEVERAPTIGEQGPVGIEVSFDPIDTR